MPQYDITDFNIDYRVITANSFFLTSINSILKGIIRQANMSASRQTHSIQQHSPSYLYSPYQGANSHPYNQLIKGILQRLDYLQSAVQSKNFSSSTIHKNKNISKSLFNSSYGESGIDSLTNQMHSLQLKFSSQLSNLSESIETNFTNLNDTFSQNLQLISTKTKNFQAKIYHLLKQKQQILTNFQHRITSSQKILRTTLSNIKQLQQLHYAAADKFAQQKAREQNQAYDKIGQGLKVFEGRLKVNQELIGIREKKINDEVAILKQTIVQQIKELDQKIGKKTNRDHGAKGNLQNYQQQIEQISNKIKIFQMQSKQQKRKNLKLQQKIKQIQQSLQQYRKKFEGLPKSLAQSSQSKQIQSPKRQKLFHQHANSYKTQANQKEKLIQRQKSRQRQRQRQREFNSERSHPNSTSQIKNKEKDKQISSNSYLKPAPPLPAKHLATENDNKKNPYDLLVAGNSAKKDKNINNNRIEYQEKDYDQTSKKNNPLQNMVGGIRGLLRKSKQKQHKKQSQSPPQQSPFSNRKPLPRQQKFGQPSLTPSNIGPSTVKPLTQNLNTFGSNRALPPVKADTKLKNNSRLSGNARTHGHQEYEYEIRSRSQSQYNDQQGDQDAFQGEQEQVYQVDEDGYLIDESGNYIYDDNGDRVQISEEEMYELMKQNS